MPRLITILLAMCGFAGAQEAPVGIVTFAQGDSQIFEPGVKRGRKLQIADTLLSGSRVVTGTDGKVSFVSCAQSVAATALPKSELQFSKSGFAVTSGAIDQQRRVPSCRVPLASATGTHIGGVAMRGQSTMQLISPVGTVVPAAPVKLAWKPVDGATDYRIMMRDDDGNDLWESEAKVTTVTYDGPPKLLMGKTYRWRVTALQNDDVLSSASAMLRVLSADENKRIEELRSGIHSSDESHLLLGMLYEELNMPDQALTEYQKLPATAPGSWLDSEITALRKRLFP